MIAGILLAAGESRRMGFPKPLLPYQGTTFLAHLLAVLEGQVDPLVLVLGAQADRIRAAVRIPDSVAVVINEHYAAGQLSSLQVGLRALPRVGVAVGCGMA